MSEALRDFLFTAIPALVAGAVELARGGSKEEALAKTIETLETERAKVKFPDLHVDD